MMNILSFRRLEGWNVGRFEGLIDKLSRPVSVPTRSPQPINAMEGKAKRVQRDRPHPRHTHRYPHSVLHERGGHQVKILRS